MRSASWLVGIGLAGATLAAAGAAGCGRSGGGEVVHRRAFVAKVKGFDPAHADDLYSGTAVIQMYEPLYEYHYLKRPFVLTPLTAADLPTQSADGLTLTITIRKGIRFHDDPCFPGGQGRELTAGDYIHAWKRIADPKTESALWGYLQGHVAGLDEWREKAGAGQADYDAPVAGLQAPDPHTLVVRLAKPNPQFRLLLVMPFTAAVPREAVAHYGEGFPNHAVGTGAFRLAEWRRDSRIVMTRHPHYRDVRYPTDGEPTGPGFAGDEALGRLAQAGQRVPFCDRIEVDIVVEDQPRWLLFTSREVDLATIPKDAFGQAVRGTDVSPELAAAGVRLERVADLDLTLLVFNMQDPVLGKNPPLRKAIACAWDAAEIREKFHNGRAVLAQSPIPPGLFGYDAAYRSPHAFDLAKAKAHLAEAGFPEGRGAPEIVFDTNETDTTNRQAAELAREHLARIGLKLRIEVNTWPAFQEKANAGNVQLFGFGWGADYPDPENFLQLFYGPNSAPIGQNSARFRDAEYDRLYEEMRVLPDGDERYRKIRRMVDILAEQVPVAFELHRDAWILSHPWCRNAKYPQVWGGYWKYLYIDPAERLSRVG